MVVNLHVQGNQTICQHTKSLSVKSCTGQLPDAGLLNMLD